jgi:hypothetical protein
MLIWLNVRGRPKYAAIAVPKWVIPQIRSPSAVDADEEDDLDAVLAQLREARRITTERRAGSGGRRRAADGLPGCSPRCWTPVCCAEPAAGHLAVVRRGRIYRPAWSTPILDELEYHEERKLIRRGSRRDEAHRRAARLIAAMRTAFDDAAAPGCGRAMVMNYGRARLRSRERL